MLGLGQEILCMYPKVIINYNIPRWGRFIILACRGLRTVVQTWGQKRGNGLAVRYVGSKHYTRNPCKINPTLLLYSDFKHSSWPVTLGKFLLQKEPDKNGLIQMMEIAKHLHTFQKRMRGDHSGSN